MNREKGNVRGIATLGLLILLLNTLNLLQRSAQAKNAVPSSAASLVVSKSPQARNTPAFLCPAQLSSAINAVTNRPQFSRERWGILIQTLSTSQTLYNHDAQNYFVPASNVKLLTTAAALHRLGAEFKIRTSIYGTDDGALWIVGRGDPSLTDAQLRELALQLSRQGIRQVRQLTAKDDYFQGYAINPTWEWEDLQADYGAPINSLILNQNVVVLKLLPQQLGKPLQTVWDDPIEAKHWRIENKSITANFAASPSINISRDFAQPKLKITGQLSIDAVPKSITLPVLNPTEHFLNHFRRTLSFVGINEILYPRQYTSSRIASGLIGRLRQTLTTSEIRELAAVESPPLSQLLIETNQNSNNLYAEALLRTLGVQADKRTEPTDATAPLGLGVIKATLTTLGVDPGGYVLEDGSGLSRHNLVSPEAIAQTLKAMAKSPLASVYRASLPVAGISGTLQNRFRNTPAQGILQAKTGTMSGVVALSGYIDVPTYQPLVFSIMVNQSDQSTATLRQAIDEIVLLLVKLRRC